MYIQRNNSGFTLIELIIYLGLVSIILVSISLLAFDLLAGQSSSLAKNEVSHALRTITNAVQRDIHRAQSIDALSSEYLLMTVPAGTVAYGFNALNDTFGQSLNGAATTTMHSDFIAATGAFIDYSYLTRSPNVGVTLTLSNRTGSAVAENTASSTVSFSIQLRGVK